jgi:glycosyltransferase involved in cell wall biosynthesis
MSDGSPLRVALIAGSLGQGGAEKQLLYLARELVRAEVEVQVFALTYGEHYESLFERAGVRVEWAGRHRPPLRIADLAAMVRRFRPHVVQAGHFFTNLYAVAAARVCGGAEIGAIRNDTHFDMAECGRWGRALLRAPRTLVANSREAARNAEAAGADANRVYVLTNVIDLDEFDRCALPARHAKPSAPAPHAETIVAAVARLVPAKRLDRLLRAIARARGAGVPLRGLIVGDGPERGRLEALACELGLLPEGVAFAGARPDVPRLLAGADILALTSQHEGFPNVVMEAMAARLPVVCTPAGDAASLVQEGVTGFVVPFDDEERLAARLIELAQAPAMRCAFGAAGRAVIEGQYRVDTLVPRALRIYQDAARLQHRTTTLQAVDSITR